MRLHTQRGEGRQDQIADVRWDQQAVPAPEPERAHEYVSVGFIGQVPVLVRGACKSGDYIVASGFEDGTAIAISPEDLEFDDLEQVLGRAWSDATGALVSVVNVAIGINTADAAQVLRKQAEALKAQRAGVSELRNQLADAQRQISSLTSRMEQLEMALPNANGR